jgi:hypothetical protein
VSVAPELFAAWKFVPAIGIEEPEDRCEFFDLIVRGGRRYAPLRDEEFFRK